MQAFIADWSMAQRKAKGVGCDLTDKMLAFVLLDAASLSAVQTNLVLTGVDYGEENLLEQMQNALKKFLGRSAVGGAEKNRSVSYTPLQQGKKLCGRRTTRLVFAPGQADNNRLP